MGEKLQCRLSELLQVLERDLFAKTEKNLVKLASKEKRDFFTWANKWLRNRCIVGSVFF